VVRFAHLILLSCAVMISCSNPAKVVPGREEKGIPYDILSDTSGYQWVKTSWAAGANAYCFAQNKGVWYLGTDNGELLASDDSGSTWTRKLDLPEVTIRSIAMAGGTILLAACGYLENGNLGVFRSVDNGQTFQRVTIAGDDLRPMTIKARNDTVIAVWALGWLGNRSEIGCVRASIDAGRTWQKIDSSSESGFYSVLIKDDYLLASTDGIGGNDIYKMKLDGSPATKVWDEQVYAGATDFDTLGDTILSSNSGKSIIRSLDNGNTWDSLTEQDSTGWVDGIITFEGAILFGSEFKGIMISRDGGTSFSQFNSGFVQGLPDVYNFFQAGNQVYCLTVNDGVWRLIRK
jgi:hypothetical protein